MGEAVMKWLRTSYVMVMLMFNVFFINYVGILGAAFWSGGHLSDAGEK